MHLRYISLVPKKLKCDTISNNNFLEYLLDKTKSHYLVQNEVNCLCYTVHVSSMVRNFYSSQSIKLPKYVFTIRRLHYKLPDWKK
jgi:hypothetical protein